MPMLSEVQRSNPSLEVTRLSSDTELALDLWDKRGVFGDAEKLTSELNELLIEVADQINSWDQDTRDGALGLVEALSEMHATLPQLSSEQQTQLAGHYIEIVRQLKPNEDWLGSPWTALDIGHNIAKILGKEIDFADSMRARGQLAEAWNDYAAKVSFNSGYPTREQSLFHQSFRPNLRKLQNTFMPRSNEAIEEETQRNGPDLDGSNRELALWFGQNTRGKISAKLNVLRATPNFRAELSSKGVDLADFWNLNDPEQAVQDIENILDFPRAGELFLEKFKAKAGDDYVNLSEDEKRHLADLSFTALREVYGELANRSTGFSEVSQRILDQVQQASALENPKKKLKPVIKWLQQVDPGFNSYDALSIEEFIKSNLPQLEDLHRQRHAANDEAIAKITEILPPAGVVKFMDRSIFDLKSGNLTGDCTAWNMDVGSNAWTVPVWVTNPMFNFAYIYSGNTIAAKFGMILALNEDGQARVFIDSIETNKNIPKSEDNTALEAIYRGFAELQDWADRNGFGTLQVCTFTNSDELTANLPIIQDTDREKLSGYSFDGLRASDELLAGLDGDFKTPNIYLQSSAVVRDEFGDIIHGIYEHTPLADVFEDLAQTALVRTRKEDSDSLISDRALLEALRSGDKERVVAGIFEAMSPTFAAAFEYDHQTLIELYQMCKDGLDRGLSVESAFNAVIASFDRKEVDFETGSVESDIDDLIEMSDEDYTEYLAKRQQSHARDQYMKEREDRYEKIIRAEEEQKRRSILAPEGLSVLDYDALDDLIEELEKHQPKYRHPLDIMDELFMPEMDIEAAAKYVFGNEAELDRLGEAIPLGNFPIYNRGAKL